MTDTMTTTGIIDRSVHAADAEMRLGRARVPEGPIRRMCSIAGLQARAAADDGDGDTAHERIVTGYASVTEEPYEMADMFGPYSEIVDADAFARTLGQDPDVVLTINHSGLGLARTKAGTLSLTADDTGLKFTAAVDVRESDAADLVTRSREARCRTRRSCSASSASGGPRTTPSCGSWRSICIAVTCRW